VLWPWSAHPSGYGRVNQGGRFRYVHHVAYELAHGAIPDGCVLDHLCCEPRCANVRHLEAVAPVENVRRQRNLKLTRETAAALRAEWHERRAQRPYGRLARGELDELAAKYGVSRPHVRNVAVGNSWLS
jgi:hypothetical protein